MASTKDILSAQRFNRSRLVTAFQSGMPDGRELTPARPWTGLIGGIIITVLIFGVAWVSRLFAPSLPAGWEDSSLITDPDTGGRYVTIGGTLHPVANASSAKLLFPGGLKVLTAGSSTLDDVPLGDPVGILGAPDQLPAPEALADSYILSCVDTTGASPVLWTGVNSGEWSDAEGLATHVQFDGVSYLVTNGHRYVLGGQGVAPEGILNALGLSTDTAVTVNASWLNLFPEGEPLEPLQVPNLGDDAGAITGVGDDVRVGTVLRVSDSAQEGDLYLVRAAGTIERMSPSMFQLYSVGAGAIYADPQDITLHDLARLNIAPDRIRPTWPQELTRLLNEDEIACGYTDSSDSMGEPDFVVAGELPQANLSGVSVAPHSGAILHTLTEGGVGVFLFVDENGTAHPMGSPQGTLAALGLAEAETLRVTPAWSELFAPGVLLSEDAAWQTVPEDDAL